MSDPIFELRRVAAGYGDRTVIEQLSLSVSAGEIVAVTGANAAGKTTLLRALFRHGAWIRGELFWRGHPVSDLRDPGVDDHDVAWARQDRPGFGAMTVLEALDALAAAPTRQKRQEQIARVCSRWRELEAYARQPMNTLSGGERAIATIALSLINTPRLLCLDEPAANLSSSIAKRAGDDLRRYAGEHGCACLLIEHNRDFLGVVADREISV